MTEGFAIYRAFDGQAEGPTVARMTRRSAVLGYVVMVVLLSAGAAQSLTSSNTVYSDDIVDGQVAYADIRDNAMTGKKILDGSITGADIKEETLALTCPTNLSRVGDVCFGDENGTTTADAAFDACASAGLRLPSAPEASLVARAITGDNEIWVEPLYFDGAASRAPTVGSSGAVFTGSATSRLVNYRCVISVGSRP